MDKILEYIRSNQLHKAQEILNDMNPADIAEYLEEIEDSEMLIIFRLLPKDLGVDVFSLMPTEERQYIVNKITDKELGKIIDDLYLDDTVDFIEELPATVVKKVLANTSKEKRNLINQYLNYPEDSAGSLMTIEFVDLKKEMTVAEAIQHIRDTGVDRETIDTCYVTDDSRKLEGVLSIRTLILSDETQKISDIMGQNIIKIKTLDDQEFVADQFKKYDFYTMPVVDKEDRLVGIITLDDIVDIIEMENTEDFQKMAAMEPTDEPYLRTNPFKLAKHRIVWLMVLMISATLTGGIIGQYEDVLDSVVLLTAFIPMLMDTAGNSGSQSSTLVIRNLALGEVEIKDILKVLFKEFQVSLIVGVVLSILNFIRIYLQYDGNVTIAFTVSFTLLFTIVLAKLLGGTLPMLAKLLKLDPAIMAGPLITTIVDAAALVVYFQIATRLMHIV